MSIYAAVLTSQYRSAIASIELFGEGAEEIISAIFRQTSMNNQLKPHKYFHGKIIKDGQIIDEVLVACTSQSNYTIHCHGNPLIIKNILLLLNEYKVSIVNSQRIVELKAASVLKNDMISIEAMAEHPRSKTINGVKLILNQAGSGLKRWASEGLQKIDKISSVKIRHSALMIQQNSETAGKIIDGFKVILTGPPNSGKSTFLNTLAGRTKAIVSDIQGTTRDWVSINCKIKDFAVEFVDTAGLDPHLAVGGKIDKESQQTAKELLKEADMILLVLDGNSDSKVWFEHESLWQSIIEDNTPVLTVLNKADISNSDKGGLWISALNNIGTDKVIDKIIDNLKLNDIELTDPVCFTDRQMDIIHKLTKERSRELSKILLTRLLNDTVQV